MTTESSDIRVPESFIDDRSRVEAISEEWGPSTPSGIERLRKRGVSLASIMYPWPLGETRVNFDGRYFDADPDGKPALILGVSDRGRLVDLAAWDMDTDRFGTWLGQGFALGQDQIFNPATWFLDDSLTIHRTPLGWLQLGRQGIVILDPERAWCWLQHVPRVICRDAAHGEEIEALLWPPKPKVEILVPRRAAA